MVINMKRRILVIGPSVTKSFGGMVTVIKQIHNSPILNEKYEMNLFSTYIDGNVFMRVIYSIFKYLMFLFTKEYKKYDLFHIHMAANTSTYRKMAYAKLILKNNRKYIIHIHAAEYYKFFCAQKNKKKEKIELFFKNASKIIVLSEYWKKTLSDIIPVENYYVVNNCIDYDYYSNIIRKKEDSINFLCLGRVGERKGSWDITKAVVALKEKGKSFKVFVAGDGEIDKLRKIVLESKIDNYYEIVGWADDNKKIDLFQKTDVLLLPSYNEGLPMAILEAMASGKAIISTYVGAIPEVVKDENGFLIKPGDINGLINAMDACFNNKKLEEIRNNNQEVIRKHYDLKVFINTLDLLYSNILNNENK